MNKVELIGRLSRDPDIRYSGEGQDQLCIARFKIAVDRKQKRRDDDERSADFISCLAFGKLAEHVDRYYRKGLKIAIVGHIQTGSYKHRDGYTVYTTDVVADELEFVESRNAGNSNNNDVPQTGKGYFIPHTDYEPDDGDKPIAGDDLPF
jgi:single stranded DNA-binding protein (ssb)